MPATCSVVAASSAYDVFRSFFGHFSEAKKESTAAFANLLRASLSSFPVIPAALRRCSSSYQALLWMRFLSDFSETVLSSVASR